jgi:hypothetical protein
MVTSHDMRVTMSGAAGHPIDRIFDNAATFRSLRQRQDEDTLGYQNRDFSLEGDRANNGKATRSVVGKEMVLPKGYGDVFLRSQSLRIRDFVQR